MPDLRNRVVTHGSKWGPGKVHLHAAEPSPGGMSVPTACGLATSGRVLNQKDSRKTPLTCKKCLRLSVNGAKPPPKPVGPDHADTLEDWTRVIKGEQPRKASKVVVKRIPGWKPSKKKRRIRIIPRPLVMREFPVDKKLRKKVNGYLLSVRFDKNRAYPFVVEGVDIESGRAIEMSLTEEELRHWNMEVLLLLGKNRAPSRKMAWKEVEARY